MITPLSFLYRLRRPSLLRPEPRCSVSAAPPTCGLVAAAVISLVGSACSDPPTSPVDADGLNGAIEAPDEVPAAATRCPGYRAAKNAYFGDLHIHTAYSLDSFSFANRNDPAAAYRFARGLQAAPVSAGEGGTTTVPALSPPLDFAAVTDHSEFLSMMGLCEYGAATPW
jgi:Protein of unknown function (DUF3604)